jgi:DNA-binding transcriptional ArsR family regulator
MGIGKNDIKFKIFKLLVDSADMLTLNQISKSIKEPAQKVAYHLPQLEKMGIIIKDENKYYCQPVFIDKNFYDLCFGKLEDILPEMVSRLFIDSNIEDENEKKTIILNCMIMQFTIIMNSV